MPSRGAKKQTKEELLSAEQDGGCRGACSIQQKFALPLRRSAEPPLFKARRVSCFYVLLAPMHQRIWSQMTCDENLERGPFKSKLHLLQVSLHLFSMGIIFPTMQGNSLKLENLRVSSNGG